MEAGLPGMELRLLGPVEVRHGGQPVPLGGRQRKTLVAILAVHRGEAVSTDRLIDQLWGDSPPAAARKTVQAHISHLRRLLNSRTVILSGADDGYRLELDETSVDARRFEALITEGRRTAVAAPGEALRLLDEALSLFRGEPLAGVADDAFSLRVEAGRLAELRLAAVEDRLEARLAVGEATEVATEAEQLVAEHPLRERMWALLMLALYRTGRQSEALRAYSRLRRTLGDQLGIDPSPAVQVLEQQILDHDPALGEGIGASLRIAGPARTADAQRNPYKGLRAFDEADAADFFGRDDLVRRLLERLSARTPTARLVVLAGPSGAGKSSSVRAGLLPRLREGVADDWEIVDMFPGTDPFSALAKALAVTRDSPSGDLERHLRHPTSAPEVLVGSDPVLVVVDQFEEVFTLVDDDGETARFLDLLARAVTSPHLDVRVIATIRADFLDRPLNHPGFAELLEPALVLVPPLSEHEVRAAVLGPADRVGVAVEPELVAEIVRDVATRPASLPLLQFAMADLFERRRSSELTLEAYRAAGGLSGALARRAEEIYGSFNAGEQEAIRQMVLRLVTVSDEGEHLRRRASRTELEQLPVAARSLERVIAELGRHRLLIFDQDPESGAPTVEVAHESLLVEWPRVANWIQALRNDLRVHRDLRAAVRDWTAAGRDPSYLPRGARLAFFEQWTQVSGLSLTEDELGFVSEGRSRQHAAERQRTVRRRVITGTLGVAALIALVLALFAFDQRTEARRQASVAQEEALRADDEKDRAEAEAVRADEQARIASVRELAAASAASLTRNPELSVLLAIEAVEISRQGGTDVLPEAEEALHRAVQTHRQRLILPSSGAAYFSPDSTRIVGGGPDDVPIYDAQTGEQVMELVGHADRVFNAVWSADGSILATNGFDATTRLWDAETGQELHRFDYADGGAISVAISPDSRLVATSTGTTVRVWDIASGDRVAIFPSEGSGGINFGPGGLLAVAKAGSGVEEPTIDVWDVSRKERIVSIPSEGQSRAVDTAFDPGGTFLAVAHGNHGAVYDTESWALVYRMFGHTDGLQAIDVAPNGRWIATGSVDGTARLFDAETGEPGLVLVGHGAAVINVAFSPDGTRLATGGSDDTTRVWDIGDTGGSEWLVFDAPGSDVDYSPDGTMLATSAFGAGVFDAATGERVASLDGHEDFVLRAQFSPDGSELATASFDGTVRIWDPRTGEEKWVLEHAGPAVAASFSRDGTRLVTADYINLHLWDITTGDRLWSTPAYNMEFGDLELSPDDAKIATSGFDGRIKMWDAADGRLLWDIMGHGGFDPASRQLDFSPDGKTVATISFDGTARVWDSETGDEVVAFGEGSAGGELNAVDFSPDGRLLATAGTDGSVTLWDVELGVERLQVARLPETVFGVEFSPDGSRLAVSTFADQVHVFAVDIDDLVEIAKARVSRSLAEDECRRFLHTDGCV